MCFEVEKVLYHEKSQFQDIVVFKSTNHGNVLVLDNILQLTEKDEFCYHEMMVHLPLNSHPAPKEILIVGGGDGGSVREVMKHPEVEHVTLCEIDEKVIEVSKKYFPNMTCSFDDPRLDIKIGDGLEFIKKNRNAYDVIITDSSDCIGPAKLLFEKEYYELMKSALKPNGIICSQGENVWLSEKIVVKMIDFCRDIFPVVSFAYCSVPSYTSGEQAFTLCSLNPHTDFKKPVRSWGAEETAKYGLKYYNSSVHQAAFALPEFFRRALQLPV